MTRAAQRTDDEGRLGPHDDEADVVLLGKGQQLGLVLGADGQVGDLGPRRCRAAVAGGHVDVRHAARLGQLVRDGMLTPAGPQHQHRLRVLERRQQRDHLAVHGRRHAERLLGQLGPEVAGGVESGALTAHQALERLDVTLVHSHQHTLELRSGGPDQAVGGEVHGIEPGLALETGHQDCQRVRGRRGRARRHVGLQSMGDIGGCARIDQMTRTRS